MDDKKKNLMIIIGVVLIVIIIIIIVATSLVGGGKRKEKLSFQELEQKIKEVGQEYYEENKSLLPKNDGDTKKISVDDLVKLELMDPIEDILDEDATCTGELTVKKENGKYFYIPSLDCGDKYVTSELYKKIIDDNAVVESGNGLYLKDNEYIFRGENVNNYVTFADKTWKIVKIDSDNDIEIILDDLLDSTEWDDRYNGEKQSTVGINNFSVSRIKDTLNELYDSEDLLSKKDKEKIVPKNICIDHLSEDDNVKNISSSCSNYEEKVNISLLSVKDFVNASIDSNCVKVSDNQCQNYNHLASFDNSKSWWTITGSKDNTYQIFYVDSYGVLDVRNAINSIPIRPVVYISKDIMFSKGKGTEKDPYVVE